MKVYDFLNEEIDPVKEDQIIETLEEIKKLLKKLQKDKSNVKL